MVIFPANAWLVPHGRHISRGTARRDDFGKMCDGRCDGQSLLWLLSRDHKPLIYAGSGPSARRHRSPNHAWDRPVAKIGLCMGLFTLSHSCPWRHPLLQQDWCCARNLASELPNVFAVFQRFWFVDILRLHLEFATWQFIWENISAWMEWRFIWVMVKPDLGYFLMTQGFFTFDATFIYFCTCILVLQILRKLNEIYSGI